MNIEALSAHSAQEVFDYIVGALLKQKAKSQSADKCGLLHGPNGLKCPGGWLLSKPQVKDIGERYAIWSQLVSAGLVPHDHCNLIQDLQRVHDLMPVYKWRENFKRVADKHGLQLRGKYYN